MIETNLLSFRLYNAFRARWEADPDPHNSEMGLRLGRAMMWLLDRHRRSDEEFMARARKRLAELQSELFRPSVSG